MDSILNQLTAHLEENSKQLTAKGDESKPSRVSYGTAGFRGDAAQVGHLFYNVGLISGLRCLVSKANIGVMITASHNPIQDNGVKLIDPEGEMLASAWESIVERFCNTQDTKQLLEQLSDLLKNYELDTKEYHRVLIGMDTRPSSEALMSLVKQGLEAWAPYVKYVDYGTVTTPALHYLVAESNKRQIQELPANVYYNQLIEGLVDIFAHRRNNSFRHYSPKLVIDCANGVGSETMQYLMNDDRFIKCLPVQLINTGDGILNRECGADFVKTQHKPPCEARDIGNRYAALDGDADRVVYFYLENESKLNLLDGDKIMALYAHFLKDSLKEANLEEVLSMGIVQTAYANGASTDYLTKVLGLVVDFVDTGVKNLHKKALDYDIAIYFEANGHGTIWLSEKARSTIMQSSHEDLKRLLAIIINYTGDAISDILVVESILMFYDWSIDQWYKLYEDRPNVLTKIEIPDRSLIKTANAGRTCVEPEGLQSAIDLIVNEFGAGSRTFVRPSGTENVVRVYAEANDQKSALKLASSVGDKVKQFCM